MMGKGFLKLIRIAVLSLSITTSFTDLCDASSIALPTTLRKVNQRRLDTFASSDPYQYFGSPFSYPPYDDSTGSPPPASSPLGSPLYCVYPSPPSWESPFLLPPPPSLEPPMPSSPPPPFFAPPLEYSPPPSVIYPSPSPPNQYEPSPPSIYEPSPPNPIYNPPIIFVPSPPNPVFNPPIIFIPSPPTAVLPPIIFQPPIIYPPPLTPPPPPASSSGGGYGYGLWCVAKPAVPDPIIQQAMTYACGSGADCDSIAPTGSCFEPNSLIAHASFAFNSYWQRTKAAGGSCDFGGTAMLVTQDPSFDGCHFLRT